MDSFVTVDRFYNKALIPDIEAYPGGIVFPLDKPYLWTSADAVRKIKFQLQKFFHRKNIKVGHAGTLDPLATGVLLVCVGKATKCAEQLQASEKEYVATIRTGATTPSFDLEKEIDATYPYEHITEEAVVEALKGFIGEQMQVPPIFSAKLIDGTRAYDIARSGNTVEMKASKICIYDAELLKFNLPDITVRLRCSKGTYVRSFARDLGEALGSGAHLTALQRSRSGLFLVENALSMESLSELFKIS